MLIGSWKVVETFEEAMAKYTGARYAVSCDTCTAALFLCFKRLEAKVVTLPARTYLGVACAAIHAGAKLKWWEEDQPGFKWKGNYMISCQASEDGIKLPVVDSACRLRRGWGGLSAPMCLSFQYRKHLKIGRGGMILTDDKNHADWFRKARFCGRGELGGKPEFVGWHCYMEPERAARGLTLLQNLPSDNPDLQFDYPDLREYEVLR